MNYQLVCRIKTTTLSLEWNPAKFSFQWTTWELCLFMFAWTSAADGWRDYGWMYGSLFHYGNRGASGDSLASPQSHLQGRRRLVARSVEQLSCLHMTKSAVQSSGFISGAQSIFFCPSFFFFFFDIHLQKTSTNNPNKHPWIKTEKSLPKHTLNRIIITVKVFKTR